MDTSLLLAPIVVLILPHAGATRLAAHAGRSGIPAHTQLCLTRPAPAPALLAVCHILWAVLGWCRLCDTPVTAKALDVIGVKALHGDSADGKASTAVFC